MPTASTKRAKKQLALFPEPKPHKATSRRPRPDDDPNWRFSFQPPTEAEWQEHLAADDEHHFDGQHLAGGAR